MIIKYCNMVFYNSCDEDYLEMVDLIQERGYTPDENTPHDITDEMIRVKKSESGKFDKHRQFKICFDTDAKTYSYVGESLKVEEFFNDTAPQETKRDMKLLQNSL